MLAREPGLRTIGLCTFDTRLEQSREMRGRYVAGGAAGGS